MEQTIKSRIRLARGTPEVFEEKLGNKPLLLNEIVLVDIKDESNNLIETKIKIGDGETEFENLPYILGNVTYYEEEPDTKRYGDIWFDKGTKSFKLFNGEEIVLSHLVENIEDGLGEKSIQTTNSSIAGTMCFKFEETKTHEVTKYYIKNLTDDIIAKVKTAINNSNFHLNDSDQKAIRFSMRLTNNFDYAGYVLDITNDDGGYLSVVTEAKQGNRIIIPGDTTILDGSTKVAALREDGGSYLFFPEYPDLGTEIMGEGAVALGVKTKAQSNGAHAEGDETVAAGRYTHAEGTETKAIGYASHAEGKATISIGQNSHSEGVKTNAGGYASHAEGQKTEAIGGQSHAEGAESVAEGDQAHAEGLNTWAKGQGAHSEGLRGAAIGAGAHVEGRGATEPFDENGKLKTWDKNAGLSIAEGEASHVEGLHNYAKGIAAHAEGTLVQARGEYSHAEGKETEASGNYAHVEGLGYLDDKDVFHPTIAEGEASHAEGRGTKALGKSSHAEGKDTEATQNNAHAEGLNTHASGENSHSEGNNTWAKANNAHAEGHEAQANGIGSHAEGKNTRANGEYQHVEGSNNIADNNNKYIHIAGNGVDGNNRSNAYTLDWEGNAWYAGNIVAGLENNQKNIVATGELKGNNLKVNNSIKINDKEIVDSNGNGIFNTLTVGDNYPVLNYVGAGEYLPTSAKEGDIFRIPSQKVEEIRETKVYCSKEMETGWVNIRESDCIATNNFYEYEIDEVGGLGACLILRTTAPDDINGGNLFIRFCEKVGHGEEFCLLHKEKVYRPFVYYIANSDNENYYGKITIAGGLNKEFLEDLVLSTESFQFWEIDTNIMDLNEKSLLTPRIKSTNNSLITNTLFNYIIKLIKSVYPITDEDLLKNKGAMINLVPNIQFKSSWYNSEIPFIITDIGVGEDGYYYLGYDDIAGSSWYKLISDYETINSPVLTALNLIYYSKTSYYLYTKKFGWERLGTGFNNNSFNNIENDNNLPVIGYSKHCKYQVTDNESLPTILEKAINDGNILLYIEEGNYSGLAYTLPKSNLQIIGLGEVIFNFKLYEPIIKERGEEYTYNFYNITFNGGYEHNGLNYNSDGITMNINNTVIFVQCQIKKLISIGGGKFINCSIYNTVNNKVSSDFSVAASYENTNFYFNTPNISSYTLWANSISDCNFYIGKNVEKIIIEDGYYNTPSIYNNNFYIANEKCYFNISTMAFNKIKNSNFLQYPFANINEIIDQESCYVNLKNNIITLGDKIKVKESYVFSEASNSYEFNFKNPENYFLKLIQKILNQTNMNQFTDKNYSVKDLNIYLTFPIDKSIPNKEYEWREFLITSITYKSSDKILILYYNSQDSDAGLAVEFTQEILYPHFIYLKYPNAKEYIWNELNIDIIEDETVNNTIIQYSINDIEINSELPNGTLYIVYEEGEE